MLAITPGEPAGIGPDLLIALAQNKHSADWVVLTDPDMLSQRADLLGKSLRIRSAPTGRAGELQVEPVLLAQPAMPGQLNAANSVSVLNSLRKAAEGCLAGRYAGMVTGPVQKSIINDAGFPFSGHTEFLRDAGGAGDVLMLLVAGGFRVGLVTTHLPLADVPAALTAELLASKLQLLLHGLRQRFGIAEPRVLVTGLNPHAGEGGHLGREEIEVIGPVCERFRAAGADVTGPLPADTAFTPRRLESADAVLTMYHDQGLPVLKHAGFGNAVNVTLGLPFVRTSVDHGTALDVAGSGRADTGSLAAALALAAEMTRASEGAAQGSASRDGAVPAATAPNAAAPERPRQ